MVTVELAERPCLLTEVEPELPALQVLVELSGRLAAASSPEAVLEAICSTGGGCIGDVTGASVDG